MNVYMYSKDMAKKSPSGSSRAILYLRVSTDEQAVSGLGLAAQETASRSLCTARGWEVVGVVVDAGVSGSVSPLDRAGMADAIRQLCARDADVLVAAKLDRLSRSTIDLLGLVDHSEKCGFGIVTADAAVDSSTAAGRMVVTMLGAVAEMERRLIGERTKAALAAKKAQGHRLGRPVVTPARTRQLVAGLRREGLSLAKIAAQINTDGHRTSTGTKWTRSGVQRLVNSLALDAEAEMLDRQGTDAGSPAGTVSDSGRP